LGKVVSVGQITKYIKNLLTQDPRLWKVSVKGEASNVKYHSSGHIYFSLKDDEAQIRCVMFRGNRQGLKFALKNGDKVVCCGDVGVYEKGGDYQLYVSGVSREGLGELYERFEKLKAELLESGMFDQRYKKPIPKYALKVGVITAATGAVVHDIQTVAKRRNPYVQLVLRPAAVQGKEAVPSLCQALAEMDAAGMDVIIIGRGGGSMEDLWAFNEREVAEAIFRCETPVISAVGHETDTTIADYVADCRAATPTEAAELAVFSINDFDFGLEEIRLRLKRAMTNKTEELKLRARHMGAQLEARSPRRQLENKRRRAAAAGAAIAAGTSAKAAGAKLRAESLRARMPAAVKDKAYAARRAADAVRPRLPAAVKGKANAARLAAEGSFGAVSRSVKSLLSERQKEFSGLLGRYRGLNPLGRLSQGYSYIEKEGGGAVRSIGDVASGEKVTLCVTDGRIRAEVLDAEPDAWGSGPYAFFMPAESPGEGIGEP